MNEYMNLYLLSTGTTTIIVQVTQ